MECNKKVSNTCGTKNYATCVYYELDLPDFTEITGDCITIEETTQELYNLIKDVREQLDLSSLGDDCLTYPLDDQDRIIVKNALKSIEEKLCELEASVSTLQTTNICDMPIAGCDFNLGTLADECDNPPTTFGEVLQLLINQHNS